MKNKEIYTIVNSESGNHYDTNDERFYAENWERTMDNESYLKDLIKNNPEKFEGCKIEKSI